MKIKITEDQAKRLKLINENTDELSEFFHFCKVNAREINRLYIMVTHITVAQILNHEVNIEEINNQLETIENNLYERNNKAYAFIKDSNQPDLDLKIDKAYDMVNNRLTPLQIVVLDLEKLQLAATQHDLTKPFVNQKYF